MVMQHQKDDSQQQLLRLLLFILLATTALVFVVNVDDSTVLKPVLLITTSAVIIVVLLVRSYRHQAIRFSLSIIDIAFLAYILVSVVSLVKASNKLVGFESLSQLVCYFIILVVSEYCLAGTKASLQATRCLIFVITISCMVAIAQIYEWFPAMTIITTTGGKANSTFGNTSYFAGYLVLMIFPLLSEVIITKKGLLYHLFLIALVLTSLYLIIETEARSAWIAFAVGMILFGLFYAKTPRHRFITLGALAIGGILAAILFHDILQERLSGMFEMNPDSSIIRRLFFYDGAWKAFLSSPFIGNGIGNFIVFLPKFRAPEYWMFRSEDIVPHAHNEFLEILSETGIAGAVLVGLIVLLFFVTVRKRMKVITDPLRIQLIGYYSGIIAVLIDNLASMNLRTVPVSVGFWMLMGIALRISEVKSYSIAITLPSFVRKMWIVPYLLFAAFVWMYIPFVHAHYTAEKDLLDGNRLNLQNRREAATFMFKEGLSYDPHNAPSRFNLAANLIKDSNYTEAGAHIRQLLADYPYYPKAHLMLALCSFELGDTGTAEREIAMEMEMNTNPQTLYFASYFAFRMNQKAREYRLLRTRLDNNIKSGMNDFAAQGVARLAELCSKDSFQVDCGNLLARLREKFPSDLPILIAIVECYERLGFANDATLTLKQALSIEQNDVVFKERLKKLADTLGVKDTTRN